MQCHSQLGAGLALYQEAEALGSYLLFAGGAAACAAHFLVANFWFLDVLVAGVPLKQARPAGLACL